jgi:phospholipid transport system substrate-binding protein
MPAFAAHEDVVKPLKLVVGNVRYSKDKAALGQFAAEEQGKALLGDDWAKGTEAQRTEFKSLFQTLFAKIAFPKIREDFQYLQSVTYTEPKVEGDKATDDSTIVIKHPIKGTQQLKLKYALVQSAGAWKVLDVTVLGDSMLKGIREDQVAPIMKEGGWPNLLKLMRDKAKELEKVPLK